MFSITFEHTGETPVPLLDRCPSGSIESVSRQTVLRRPPPIDLPCAHPAYCQRMRIMRIEIAKPPENQSNGRFQK